MKKFNLSIFSMLILLPFISIAGNFTWTGTTNTDWATSSNWSTNTSGTPSTNDSVTIVTHTNLPVMAANTTVKKFTMTSGTLDCNGYTLTISATASFNGGTINNGTLTCSGTSTLTFAGTIFGTAVNATGNNILLSGSIFNSTLSVVKKGSTSDNGVGNNIFNGAVTLIDSGSGNLVLSNTSNAPDTFNAALTVSTSSTGTIYLAHQSAGNLFNDVTCNTGGVIFNTYGTSSFTGNIVVNSSSRSIQFGNSTGSSTLSSGKSISVGGSGFSAGTLTLRGFVQNGTSPSISLSLTGTSHLEILAGSVFNTNLKVTTPFLLLTGAKFYGTDSLTQNAIDNSYSSGCYFGGATYLANSSPTINYSFTIGYLSTDTFATTATIYDSGGGAISISNALFQGTTLFKNAVTGTLTNRFFIGNATIKGALTLDCVHSGMAFGSSGGITILDTSATLSLSSGFAGELKLTNVEQHNTSAISLSMTTNTTIGNNTILKLGTGSIFNGSFTYYGLRLQLNGSTFNNTAKFTRYAPNDDASDGGNVFNGTTTILDSVVNHIHAFTLSNTAADDYNGNVTFIQKGSGTQVTTVKIYPAYTKNSTFGGNVIVDGTSSIAFGANGGKVIFDGSGVQNLSKSGSSIPSFKRIQVNKSAGIVSLGYPLTLADTLFLTQGVIATDTTNLITVPDNGIVYGASDLSYIHGPIKKIGDDAFNFPTGDTALHTNPYHPIRFTTTPATGDAYTAQYFAHGSGLADSDTLDSVQVSTCEYWNLKRDVGTAGVKVRLGYTSTCIAGDPARAVVMDYYNGAWFNEGNSAYQSSSVDAADTTLIQAGTSQPITVGIHPAINIALVSPDTTGLHSATVKTVRWEKYEVAVQLPQSYMDCINNYMQHRIHLTDTVDHVHDLNPYADDSLVMKIVFTNPISYTQIVKYGFFMRNALWVSNATTGDYDLDSNETDPLSPYKVRFRFAPDTMSAAPWMYSIYIAAPFTKVTGTSSNLLPIYLGPYFFTCDSTNPDNHGFLKVNTANNRYLKFDDGNTFFGLGENLADLSKYFHYNTAVAPHLIYNKFYKYDQDDYLNSLDELHDAGANYVCLFMNPESYAPEHEFLGCYDEYTEYTNNYCPESGRTYQSGNRQWHSWAFDKVLERAHQDQIYIQLLTEYTAPVVGLQDSKWGNNCYVQKYVYPTGVWHTTNYLGPYEHPEYYWVGKDTADATDPGALYYWKRRYKYIMARWGYSVNIGMFQVGTEVDQTLKYYNTVDTLRSLCITDTFPYAQSHLVPEAITTFLDTVIGYVKNDLGERNHLFTLSYTPRLFSAWYQGQWSGTVQDYYTHFNNPNIDVMDVKFYHGNLYKSAQYDKDVQLARYGISNDVHGTDSLQLGIDKPYHDGEGSNLLHSDTVASPDSNYVIKQPVSTLFDNYDVSFHNALWATSFMNNCTSLMSWLGYRVHYWPDGVPHAPTDNNNGFQVGNFSNILGDTNHLSVLDAGVRTHVRVINKKIHHNYKMLADYFINSGIDLNDDFEAYNYYNESQGIEVYYLVNSDHKAIYGWVHNLNKYWQNAYYYNVADEKYYYCNDNTTSPYNIFQLAHFNASGTYDVTFYPTRMGSQALPDNQTGLIPVFSPATLYILLVPISTVTLGCDSATADFAFKAVQHGSGYRIQGGHDKPNTNVSDLNNFLISPNPNEGSFKIILPKSESDHYSILVYDSQVKLIFKSENLNVESFNLNLGECPKGIYFVQVISKNESSFKKVVVQ